jgi:hypothetical protein
MVGRDRLGVTAHGSNEVEERSELDRQEHWEQRRLRA